jgi:hypothetical protein
VTTITLRDFTLPLPSKCDLRHEIFTQRRKFLSERHFRTIYRCPSSSVWYEWVDTLFKENKATENAIGERQTCLTIQTVIIDHSFSLRRPYRPGLKRIWPFICSSATEINLRIRRTKIRNSITYPMYMSIHYGALGRVHEGLLTKRLKVRSTIPATLHRLVF